MVAPAVRPQSLGLPAGGASVQYGGASFRSSIV